MGCRLSTASDTIMACVRLHNFVINVDGIDNEDTVRFEQVKNMVHNGAVVVRNDDGDPIGYLHSGMDDLEALQQQEGTITSERTLGSDSPQSRLNSTNIV